MWRRVWIEKRGGRRQNTYRLRWYDRKWRLCGQSVGSSRLRAERLRSQKEAELNGAKDEPVRIRLSDFTEEHLALMAGQLAPATVRDQRETLDSFRRSVSDVYLDEVSPKDAERYFAWRLRNVKTATANKSLRTLKGIFSHGVRRGYLADNPFAAIKPVREAQKDHRVLTEGEIRSLLGACPSVRWRAFVFLALSTGMRRGEIMALEWDDVDLDTGVVVVRNKVFHPTKSRKNRMLALVPTAVELLEALRNGPRAGLVFQTMHGTPLRNNLSRQFRKIVKQAGIPKCTLHDLRRTFCSHLAMEGVNEAIVQRLAGHASITTTLRHYTGIFPEVLRSAQMRLRYATGVGVLPNSTQNGQEATRASKAKIVSLFAEAS